MLRTVGPPGSLFELLLPAPLRVLSGELAEIDRLLDDERFFVPFRPFFDAGTGRPSVPIETYLRLLFLKYRYELGYKRLCALVGDSISWRRFCRVGLDAAVPDESTIRKLTVRCGPALIEELNRQLLKAAAEGGHLDVERVRTDTTVVEADIRYPTDSGLLTRAISRIAVLMTRLAQVGAGVAFVDRSAEARRLAHSIGVWLRRRSDQAKSEVLAITGQLAELADLAVRETVGVLAETPTDSRRVRRLRGQLAVLVERAKQVIGQARQRLAGSQPDGATRLVSLCEPDARPIRKGRLGKPVEFGYKVQAVDNADGLIIDYSVHVGNPADHDLLVPAIERITRLARTPKLVAADRGYSDRHLDEALSAAGVASVVIPKTGKPSAARRDVERDDDFVAAVKWRTGCEGRISALKREHGWRRSRLRSHARVRIWCGHGVFNHNLLKLTQLRQ
jgi:IS5 family transposase